MPAVVAYVALLRGIAPSNPKMRNAELRRVFEGIGLDDVRTVISSGNVLFASDDRGKAGLERRIEAALHDHLGAPCTTIVRSRAQVERLTASDVFAGHDDGPAARANVTFLQRRAAASRPAPEVPAGTELVAVRDRAVFSLVDTTAARTPDLMGALERAYGKEITTRTWRTVHRIAAALAR